MIHILQLSPNKGETTYKHERVYIVANKKVVESFSILYKLCKCVQRIAAKTVQIGAMIKRRVIKNKKPSSQKKEKEKGQEKLTEPADDKAQGHTLLEPCPNAAPEDNDPETASVLPTSPSRSRAFFKTMKKRNITTCKDEHKKREQRREEYSRRVSYIYRA